MTETPKTNRQNHTFVLITDPESEYYLGFGVFGKEMFNVPFPEDYVLKSDKVDENNYLRKTIYSETVEFWN